MFRYQSEDFEKTRKELDESNSDYEGTEARNPQSNKKKNKTSELVAETQDRIDNNPSK